MIFGDIDLTQTEEPLMDTGVEVIPPTSDRVPIAIIEAGSSSIQTDTDTDYGHSGRIVSPNGQAILYDNRVLY